MTNKPTASHTLFRNRWSPEIGSPSTAVAEDGAVVQAFALGDPAPFSLPGASAGVFAGASIAAAAGAVGMEVLCTSSKLSTTAVMKPGLTNWLASRQRHGMASTFNRVMAILRPVKRAV